MSSPSVPSDIAIARAAKPLPIQDIAEKIGIGSDSLIPYGRYKAKIRVEDKFNSSSSARLVLVTATSPTPAGEGKTTTTVGLGDALNRIGKRAIMCLREPSLGPCFGVKGGAAGGGYAQVIPMEDINLHFTGDFHAVGAAHNLLAAMVDNHMYWDNAHGFDARRVSWGRVVDMNDRALRSVVTSLGGVTSGHPRESGFDITVASEVMAIFCLASGLKDLEERLGNCIVGWKTRDEHGNREPIRARDLNAHGAMSVLLKDALYPNLVQTLEHSPALVHGGPFANIAHGCNSVLATRLGMACSDWVVTEAGFGADLGAEKFFDIKCRQAGLVPSAVVLVTTARALKMHGGVSKSQTSTPDVAALKLGLVNLHRHLSNLRRFGAPVVVAVNSFSADTEEEIATIKAFGAECGVDVVLCTHWSDGGAGAEELAHKVVDLVESNKGETNFDYLYPSDMGLLDKLECIATKIYGAKALQLDSRVHRQVEIFEQAGYRQVPVCVAKTQYSFSANPNLLGAPKEHELPVREFRLSAGAGFAVAICGDIMTMPGLPRSPAAERIRLDDDGQIEGLF